MALPHSSIASMAKAIGVPHCNGMVAGRYCGDIKTFESMHRRGFVQDGVVHLSERRINKSVIKTFCMMAAEVEAGGKYDAMEPWERRWRTCADAEHIARLRLHVRIPRSAWELDRWTVRAQLAQVPLRTEGRKEAMQWSALVEK